MGELIALPQTDTQYDKLNAENLSKRILVFNNEVDECVVEDYTLYILKWNAEDKDLPVSARKPIRMFISTPGGSPLDCMGGLVDIMLQSKTPIITIALGMVASAGTYIFLAGHEKVCFQHSVFLIHDGELSVSNSSAKAKQTVKFFNSMDANIKAYMLSRTNMTEEFYDKIFEQEYWFYGNKEGRELGVVDKVVGEDIEIDEIL